MVRTCTIPGCERLHYARGWCHPHYRRWQRYGDPLLGPALQQPRTPWQPTAQHLAVIAEAEHAWAVDPHSLADVVVGMTTGMAIAARRERRRRDRMRRG